ncbi:MAG: DEAD/DEAH box helicase family protein [Agarilytica sp.]
MNEFVVGQRWVVDSEPELGLGIVTATAGRRVTIFFEQGDCERLYAIGQAPLTRILFSVDDEVKTNDGDTAVVLEALQQDGLMFYRLDNERIVPETSLSSEIQLNQPFMRLMTGQLDNPRWFHFKRKLNEAMSKLWQSRLNGLLGIRANLIPHQLFVAWNACEHQRVRVLLSDEVGLGKTIEAGMILSRLMKLERVNRTLVAVPNALQVQWLIELVRRFSLNAELFKGDDHDFNSGQIHIVPHNIFAEHRALIAESDFDMVIVDEAHHLVPGSDEFTALKNLGEQVEHVVLLSATPEQLGIESHFARLNLLDPAKFPKLEDFIAQEDQYVQLNQEIKRLPESRDAIIRDYQLDVAETDSDQAVIKQLLDSHGVGRVVFRNVRSAIAGFPKRLALPAPMQNDSELSDEWERKFEWLAQWLQSHKNEKVLAICHDIQQVFDCENYLWKKFGIDIAVFHEQQDLIERDRAAAYFSEDDGSQLLLCSEIGSEGRNFQFCSHLVCLDLPDHPDLLEQRIGRLDRIGQKYDVKIHVPYVPGSSTETKFTWFHKALNCIERQNPAAGSIHDQYWLKVGTKLENQSIVDEAKQAMETLLEEIRHGRDALLEMNSCRQPEADHLKEAIETFEDDSPFNLIENASDLLQFHFEETHNSVYSLIPSDKMLVPSLPGIAPEGSEVTFDRDIANQREEVKFIGWDSEFIHGLWDMLHYSELGSAAVAMLASQQLPAGHCLLEACYDIVVQSDLSATCRPFLETFSIRTLALDISDKDLSELLPEQSLQDSIRDVKRHLGREIVQSKKNEIPNWYKKCENFAELKKEGILQNAQSKAKAYYDIEIQRLEQLNKRNPQQDDTEISLLQKLAARVDSAFSESAHLNLAAIRLIVITDS